MLFRPLLLAAALLPALAGCNSAAPDPYLLTQSVTPATKPGVTEVAPEYAAASLPSLAGAIRSVRQTVGDNRLRQEIVYQNLTSLPGENLLTVAIGPPDSAALLRPPSAAEVRREMRAALPAGVASQMGPVIGENANGAYGYATASIGANGACIYAWQRVKSVSSSQSSGLSMFSGRRLSAQIRLRYCHPAMTAEQIHVLMDGLRLKDIDGRAIDMLRFAAGSGSVSTPAIVAPPPMVETPVAVTEPAPVAPKRKAVRAAQTVEDDWRAEASDSAEPAVTQQAAVTVPLPDAAASDATHDPDIADAPVARNVAPAVTVPLPE